MSSFFTLLVAAATLGTCMGQLIPGVGMASSGVGGSTGGGGSTIPKVQGSCTAGERNTAFNRCMMNFGMAHMRHFDFLARNRPVCRSEVFNCGEVDKLVRCLNSQPTTLISNRCWIIMDDVLTRTLDSYNIPCTYADLDNRCAVHKISQLKPVAQRTSTQRGYDLNPIRRLMPMISMMIYGGMNGMFGGMFGA